MRCLMLLAGQPQRMRRSASGISTQKMPFDTLSFSIRRAFENNTARDQPRLCGVRAHFVDSGGQNA